MRTGPWDKLTALPRQEFGHLATINPSDRLWQMPFAVALATPLSHRMVNLMACAFVLTACYALGVIKMAPDG